MDECGPGDAADVQGVTRGRGCLSLWIGAGLGNLQALSSCTTGPLLNPQQGLSPLCLPHVLTLPSCIARHLSHTGTISSSRALPWLVPAGFLVRGQVAPAAGRGGDRQ